ncbi:hypothetical protein PFISCL1PPCAC_27052, partial [Pristionchus fissidentatus]
SISAMSSNSSELESSAVSVENGIVHKEEQQASTRLSEQEMTFRFDFDSSLPSDSFLSTLNSILVQSRVPRSAELFPSLEKSNTFYLRITEGEDPSSMSWKGLNELITVSSVDYKHVESLLDRKNIISIFDLPDLTMNGFHSDVLDKLESDLQNLNVVESKTPDSNGEEKKAMADPSTLKKALIVTITKDEMKTKKEQKMKKMAGEVCASATMLREVQVVVDPLADDHFFLLFIKASHILDNISGIRRGPLADSTTVRKMIEATPFVQHRFLELAADLDRCSPLVVPNKEKATIEVETVKTPTQSAPPSSERVRSARSDRGPTSGHVARRLVEGSLGIRSTVTREQRKAENQMVATFAAAKREIRQRQEAVANQLNEAFS